MVILRWFNNYKLFHYIKEDYLVWKGNVLYFIPKPISFARSPLVKKACRIPSLRLPLQGNLLSRPIYTGCRDTVIDGKTGYLVPVKDAQKLAERLKKLILDKELRKRMGEQAREFAIKEFSIEQIARQTEQVYLKGKGVKSEK